MSRHIHFRSITSAIILFVSTLTSIGCGVNASEETLSISSIGPSITPQSTTQLHLILTTRSGESKDVTKDAMWSSSNTSVATVNAIGVLNTLSMGQTTIAASLQSADATTSVSVAEPQVTKLSVTSPTISVAAGSQEQYTATATYLDGSISNVSTYVQWSVNNTSVATISSVGLLTAIAPGTFTVTATSGSVAAVISGTVATASGSGTDTSAAKPQVTKLSVTSPTTSLAVGSQEQYTATATYSDGSIGNVSTSVQWSINNTSIANISSDGLLTAIAPGTFTVTATSGSVAAGIAGIAAAASGSGTNAGASSLPIAIFQGVDLSQFPVFNVSNYHASGSAASDTCTGQAGSKQLTCSGLGDFTPGQGIRVVGGGQMSAEAAVATQPLVTPGGNSTGGSHTYCYVVATADPLGGVSAPSPQTCVANEPALGIATASNYLTTTTSNLGPSPTFLWWVSEDGGPYLLLNTAGFVSGASDFGQRVGSRGGWPDGLPFDNPSIAKHEDLFSTVQTINGDQITLADPLANSLQNGAVDHDDTQAVQSAILAAVQAGGGTIVFGSGTFNVRRPAFAYVANHSYAYPPYTTNLALDPWWAVYSYLYIPNGAVGNINFQGAGRGTTLVTPPDHAGITSLLAVGVELRGGTAPIYSMQEVAAGATQVTLASEAAAGAFSPGDDIFLYSGTFNQAPEVDTGGLPSMHHFSELNTVASVSGATLKLVYPTSKRYFDDGGSSYGLTKLQTTPHNIEIQHLNINTYDRITATGDVLGMLVNDVRIQGTLSQGAFGGGYKRGVTIENSQWSFGQGTSGWGQEDEYDQFTDLAFLNNAITGFAAAGSEGPSEMARIYATEGTSQVLFSGNTFDHVSLYADQTTAFYVQNNIFNDGIIAAGVAYGQRNPSLPGDRSFLSFGSQETFSADHNTFTITPDFDPPWVIRAGDFGSGNISNNLITYSGARAPRFLIGSFSGTVSNNTISVHSANASDIIALLPDQSPSTPMTSFTAEGNVISANIIQTAVVVPDPGFTDSAPVCVRNNVLQVSQGLALYLASAIVNQQCP